MRDIVDTIHIPKFKGMWKTSLKEVGEGSTSIENLLQRLIDRSTAAVKDIKTRLESTYGISQQPQAPEQQMPERSGYEMRESNRFFGGQLTKQDISDPQAVYKLLLERISKGKEIVSQLQSFLERNTDNAIMLSTNGEPSIFVQLYNKYIEDRADPKKSKLEATEGLMASSEANMVEPTKVLKIDIFDKTVFVALTIFLRLFSLSIMEYLIDKKKVRTMQRALLVYLIAYSILYVGFVLIVNIDTYRTRIIFNYINMHSGISTILGHLIILWLFAMLLFTIMRNIRYIDSPSGSMHNEAITAEDRGNIKYRMSILSGILWIVTTISVAVS
jgi:hypothetical protein